MKKLKKILVFIVFVSILAIIINKITSTYLNKEYSELGDFSSIKNIVVEEMEINGNIEYHFVNENWDNNASSIHLDTINNTFIILAKKYIKHNNYETNYITLDKTGKKIQVDKYIPRKNENGYFIDFVSEDSTGKIIRKGKDVSKNEINYFKDCVLLENEIPPFPKWKETSNTIYIKHFSLDEFNLSDLNPFKIGNFNGYSHSSYLWKGIAYCNIKFYDEIIQMRIPFRYNGLFHLNSQSGDYESNLKLEYYKLPNRLYKKNKIRFLIIGSNVYSIKPAGNKELR